MKYFSLIVTLAFAPPLVSATDDFAAFEKQMQEHAGQTEAQFQTFQKNVNQEYKAYEKRLKQAFETLWKASAKVWGKEQAVIPSSSTMVNYSDDMSQRSVVDFEAGKVNVEVAFDPSQGETVDDAKKRLKKLVEKTLLAPPDTRPITEIVKKPEPSRPDRTKKPALAGQVKGKDVRSVTRSNVDSFADNIIQQTTISNVKGGDKIKRTVVSVEIPLVPNHIKKRASQYKADVAKFAKKYELPKEVVYAVMETESYFNPTAKSSIPAFGLMQLVPRSGARDAYRYVYKKDKVVSERYLYNPKRNIELGAAYLKKVYADYLPGINNPESRMWCTIAAYNTGAGNVYRTFAGKYSKARHGSRKAWKAQANKKINNMSTEQVFKYMQKHLPYEETQNYIVKVRERMPKYQRF